MAGLALLVAVAPAQSAPTRLVAEPLSEAISGPSGVDAYASVQVGGSIFFTSPDSRGYSALWRVRGTEVRKVLGSADGFISVQTPVVVGGDLFFEARTTTTAAESVWKLPDAAGAPVKMAEVEPSQDVRNLTAAGGTLFFLAKDDDDTTVSVWRSAGSASSTRAVATDLPASSSYGGFATAGTDTSFFVNWREPREVEGQEYPTTVTTLRAFDATTGAQTKLLDMSYSTSVAGGVTVGGTLYFPHDDGEHGRELWKSDGTVSGTAMVSDLKQGDYGSDPSSLIRHGSGIAFKARDGYTTRVWSTSGGAPQPLSSPRDVGAMVSAKGTLYMVAEVKGTNQLFSSNGVAVPTQLTSFPSGVDGVYAYDGGYGDPLVVSGGRVFFTALDGTHGKEVWSSDGTPGGSSLVTDVRAGAYSSSPNHMTDVAGTLYFTARTPAKGREWYRVTAAPAGKPAVKDTSVKGPVLGAAAVQKQAKKKVKVTVQVGAAEAVTATITGTVKVGRTTVRLTPVTRSLKAGRASVQLTGPKASVKKVTAGLATWRKAKGSAKKKAAVTATVTVRYTDAAKNSVTRSVKVNLR